VWSAIQNEQSATFFALVGGDGCERRRLKSSSGHSWRPIVFFSFSDPTAKQKHATAPATQAVFVRVLAQVGDGVKKVSGQVSSVR
jgi:hypothetical protein